MNRSIKLLLGANLVFFALLAVTFRFWGDASGVWFGVAWPLTKPWTLLSYMFTQSTFFELFFNMLWLWCFARIFLLVASSQQLLWAYFIGGLSGAVCFLVAEVLGFCSGVLFGASAAVLGIIAYAAAIAPLMPLNLFFFGRVEMRWIAVVMVALSLLAFALGNPGGGVAHMGGAAGGFGAGWVWKHRRFKLRKPRSNSDLDALLNKVKRSGYSSLTRDEQQQLFDISKKL